MGQKRACDACHSRKIQCGSARTDASCNWCDHHGLACTFNRVRGRRKQTKPKSKLSSEQSLTERLERIEDALKRTIAHHETTNTSSAASAASTPPFASTPFASTPSVNTRSQTRDRLNRDPVIKEPANLGEQFAAYESSRSPFISTPSSCFTTSVSFGHIHYAGHHLGQISSHNGMPVLSDEGQNWISSRTGEDVSFGRFHHGFQNRILPPALSPSHFYRSESEPHELPERSLVELVLDVFCTSAFRLVFPVIDRVLFEETMALAYEPCDGPPSLERISAKGCVLAFVSIMVMFPGGQRELLPSIDGDACAVKAHYLLSGVFEDSSLLSLQTVFMLHMHQTFSGRLQSASMLHAIACRIVFMLGGHTYQPIRSFGSEATRKERETRQLRMLFWLCYIFDKDIALRTGQPPLMTDDYCDLTLPENYVNCYFYLPDLDENNCVSSRNEELTPHLPGDPRLSHLKDKTCRMLYSAQSLKKSDAELLRDIRELDDELESWRLSIPPEFRPSLSITENSKFLPPNMKLPRSMRHIGLHVEYHHLMTTIHRASGRCLAMQSENGSNDVKWSGGVRSSIALSLEASRSTIIFLKAAVSGLAGEAFWIIVFYPTSAIMSLFLNIIMYPLDPQAKFDIDLLSEAAYLVRSMPVRKMTAYEMSHMKLVNDFVAELIRLAHCAIAKAIIERDQGQQNTPTG
ncbi:hypothetical protein B0J13DRAFT_516379 [Dactylonectria estremocensis]|uniref:Zn(2)-C6 fungal-type domain-containing protein n=1 Tax=Dactylonectria estremocensis TaxID=1079267 RepID=A0A9P9D0D4_9HYPO|nr:hypothetical protein B0J13DRAFT_516379 [Dactylonectria estremocensis]